MTEAVLVGPGDGRDGRRLKSVCVFCGSSLGAGTAYAEGVVGLALALASAGTEIVYGGARVGAMGLLADTALRAGARVVGVIPALLVEAEIAHDGLSELHVVASMHERKARMAELADGFIALPGGLGTLDELAEVLTWSQLGLHAKPTGFLNISGYFDDLLRFLDHAVAEGFLGEAHRRLLQAETEPERLLDAMEAWVPTIVSKWGRPARR